MFPSISIQGASNTLSVSITPSSASNKIFVIVSTSTRVTDQAFLTIFRGATNLGDATHGMVEMYYNTSSGDSRNSQSMTILDSPNTTSSTTYQAYLRTSSSSTLQINHNSTKGSITAFEIAP